MRTHPVISSSGKTIERILFFIFSISIFYLILDDFWHSLGLSYFIFVYRTYIRNLKTDIPIREIILLLATFQWIIGPIVEYTSSSNHAKYHMYTSSDHYFSFVLPGIMMLHLGLFCFKTRFDKFQFLNYVKGINKRYPRLAVTFVGVGVLLELVSSKAPESVQFILFLASQLKYVGVGFLIYSEQKNKKFIITFVVLSLVYSSVSSGFFHEMIIWAILLFPFINFKYNLPDRKIVFFTFIAIVFVFIIQSIKPVLRQGLEKGNGSLPLELVSTILVSQYSSGQLFDLTNSAESNVRFNQGWIISSIMKNVPLRTDYAYGQTFIDGTYSAIVPRLIDPSKKKAGGREDFMKFTGLPLGENTSMGISIIGEAYANFGYYGYIFMFLYGLFLSYLWKVFTDPKFRWGNMALFLPIIFLQVIKAETDFVTVFTHLVKSSFFIFVIISAINRFTNFRLS